jgi:Zn ribbon nucleic-acid-binding protein
MEETMTCPYCKRQDRLEIDLHADGFSADLLECTVCGATLTTNGQKLDTIHGPTSRYDSASVNEPALVL